MQDENNHQGGITMKLLFSITVLILALTVYLSWAQIPPTMSYQGLLTNASGVPVADGNYSLTFKLYNTDLGGSPLWTETHPSVAVIKGIFNVILGSGGSPLTLPFDQQYWLGVKVSAGTELAPRVKLTAAAYSLNAQNVADGAVTNSKLADNAVTVGKIQPNVVSSVDAVTNDGGNIDLIPQNAITVSPNDSANTITIGENHSNKADNPHSVTAAQTGSLVSMDGVSNAGGNVDLVAGSNVTIVPNDTTNTITISSTDTTGNDWRLTGNAGAGGSFLGTTDNQPLELRVNNFRVFRLEPHATSPNIIGGFSGNSVLSGVYGATIGGGGESGNINTVTDNYSTVGGGKDNTASGAYATIGGGKGNTAYGNYSTIPGGYNNSVYGNFSFAAGHGARTNATGSFVWADSAFSEDFICDAANQFDVRCTGGARFVSGKGGLFYTGVVLTPGGTSWGSLSDRNVKENFAPVDGQDILKRLASTSIETWNCKAQDPSIRHIGPMAQDFYAAFSVGEDDKHISTMDADGVALAAIQGLYEMVQEKDEKIAAQQQQIDIQQNQISGLETRLAEIEALVKSR
jgi:hypothetical protein